MNSTETEKHVKSLRRRARPEFWICLFLLLSTLAVFWQARGHDFVNYDDDLYVTSNPHVTRGLNKDTFVKAFTTTTAGNWQPVTVLSHMLDVELYGLRPGPHHMTSVLFHTLNAILLFLLLLKMTGRVWPSCLVAVLFALHPMHVESVAWIAERKDVLSAFFFILTIFAYLSYAKSPLLRNYVVMSMLFVTGLLCKPMLVTTPFVLLLLDFWPLKRFSLGNDPENAGGDRKRVLLHLVVEKTPLLLIALIFCVITYLAQRETGAVRSLDKFPLDLRISNALVSYVMYLIKMVAPAKLSVFYPFPDTIPLWRAAGSAAVLVGITVICVVNFRKRPYLIAGWLFYLGTLVPVIGLVQVGAQAMADRYTYIPYIGLFVAVSWTLAEFAGTERKRIVLAAGLGIAAVAMGFASHKQVKYWRNSILLFDHALSVDPANHVAHNNLGNALADIGSIRSAIKHYEKAVRIEPGYADAYYNLGVAYGNLKNDKAAMENYLYAIHFRPDHEKALYNLALIFSDLGNHRKAEEMYRKVLKLNSSHYRAHNNLGGVLLAMDRPSEAVAHFKEALKIAPEYREAKKNLELVLSKQ